MQGIFGTETTGTERYTTHGSDRADAAGGRARIAGSGKGVTDKGSFGGRRRMANRERKYGVTVSISYSS